MKKRARNGQSDWLSDDGRRRWNIASRRHYAHWRADHPTMRTIILRRVLDDCGLIVMEHEPEITESDGRILHLREKVALPDGREGYVDYARYKSQPAPGSKPMDYKNAVRQRKLDWGQQTGHPVLLVYSYTEEGMRTEIRKWMFSLSRPASEESAPRPPASEPNAERYRPPASGAAAPRPPKNDR